MWFKFEGSDAARFFNSLTGTLESLSKVLVVVAKRTEFEVAKLDAEVPASDDEVQKHLKLKELRHQADIAMATADLAEAEVRTRRAKLAQGQMNRATQQRPRPPVQQQQQRPVPEHKKELTQNLGEKLQKVVS